MPAKRLPPALPSSGVAAVASFEVVPALLRVVVQIGDRQFDEDLAAQAAIAPNIDALNEGLALNPSRFGEWAMIEAMAREQYDVLVGKAEDLASDIEDLEAKIFLEVVTPPVDAPPNWKQPTVDAVKARVRVDPRRQEIVDKRAEVKEAVLVAKAALEKISVGRRTIDRKQESLLAIASNWRQEMQQKLAVNAQQYRPRG